MQLQLPLWGRELVLLLSPPTVLGWNIKVWKHRADVATHDATAPIRALLSVGPSLLLKLCLSSCCAPLFLPGHSISPGCVPCFASCCLHSSASLLCVSLCPFADSGVSFHHFKCLELPLGLSPPLAGADLC